MSKSSYLSKEDEDFCRNLYKMKLIIEEHVPIKDLSEIIYSMIGFVLYTEIREIFSMLSKKCVDCLSNLKIIDKDIYLDEEIINISRIQSYHICDCHIYDCKDNIIFDTMYEKDGDYKFYLITKKYTELNLSSSWDHQDYLKKIFIPTIYFPISIRR